MPVWLLALAMAGLALASSSALRRNGWRRWQPLAQLQRLGARLVAGSPQTPGNSRTTTP